ncbi:MAG: clpP [Bacteroidetes bacterium]|nr:clpP [Bacteroidota bacterium]
MNNIDDFRKYARSKFGVSSLQLHRLSSIYGSYISPTIIEERQLNVASMDVFSRLMMDRIIFLGLPIDDDVANIIQAQLLYLDSSDPGKDIQIYFNTPGGHVHAGLHQPMGGFEGQASDIEIQAREILKIKNELYEIIALHTGNPVEKVAKDADRDHWMTSFEAKEYGMIDEILQKTER